MQFKLLAQYLISYTIVGRRYILFIFDILDTNVSYIVYHRNAFSNIILSYLATYLFMKVWLI